MSYTHSREEILSGIGFNTIVDSKFKTNVIAVKLFTKLDYTTVALNSLAISTIGSANSTYKTIPLFNQRLNELYGSSISSDVAKIGDIQVLSLVGRYIDEHYAYGGENLTEILTDMVLECIFNPVVENDSFNNELFNISKKELLDTIESEINNKRTYAIMQSKRTIYKGEPSSVASYGDKEHTINATAKECYYQYKKLLSSCNMEIFYIGAAEKSYIKDRFKQAFANINRSVEDFPISTPSIIKSTVEEVTNQMDVNQSKMVLAFKTNNTNRYSNTIMNTILGMSPFSKLFVNVREKLSLCYYCQSSYDNQKKTIFIDSGVEVDNIQKAKDSILQQVKDIQQGNFTNEDINNAIKYICNSIKFMGDTQSSYIHWYFNNILIGENKTVEEEYSKYSAVTKEDIILSAKTLTLDTIYILKPLEKENS